MKAIEHDPSFSILYLMTKHVMQNNATFSSWSIGTLSAPLRSFSCSLLATVARNMPQDECKKNGEWGVGVHKVVNRFEDPMVEVEI